MLRNGGPELVAQPILDLGTGEVSGYEALSRFPFPPYSRPEDWFSAAMRSGLGPILEARAIAAALDLGRSRPSGTTLSVNVSPTVLDTRELEQVLPKDLSGLQFEVTEHELSGDADTFLATLGRLRDRGAQIAVDDVGEGYAGLKRLMRIRPDVLKLDRALVHGVSAEPQKAALLEAVVFYAARTGARVCAEGVETIEDLVTIAELDVAMAQGWVVGHPSPDFAAASASATALCASNRLCEVTDAREPRAGHAIDVAGLLHQLSHATNMSTVDTVISSAGGLVGCTVVRVRLIGDLLLDRGPTTERVLSEHILGQVLAATAQRGTREHRVLTSAGCDSLLMLPLVSAGSTLGVLECLRPNVRPWSHAEVRTARTIAAAIGPVVDNVTRPL